jgi:Flp pilus assembly pilin Flp
MASLTRRSISEECGATAIESALMASLLALVLVVALTALGIGLGIEFTEVGGALK